MLYSKGYTECTKHKPRGHYGAFSDHLTHCDHPLIRTLYFQLTSLKSRSDELKQVSTLVAFSFCFVAILSTFYFSPKECKHQKVLRIARTVPYSDVSYTLKTLAGLRIVRSAILLSNYVC